MEKSKSIKVIIAIIYLIFLSAFLYFLFSKFSIQEIISYISYDFIKYNSKYLTGLRESNLFLISITFILIGIFWISVLQGFGSILILASGFIFGTIIGTIISVQKSCQLDWIITFSISIRFLNILVLLLMTAV